MKASELYTLALEDYKAVICSKQITFLDYCKEHRICYGGIKTWMYRNSITLSQLRESLPHPVKVFPSLPDKSIYPLSIQHPDHADSSPRKGGSPCIKGVNITFPDGVTVTIKEITREDLNKFILTYTNQ